MGTSVYECYSDAGIHLLDDRATILEESGIELLGVSSAIAPISPRGRVSFRIALCHYPAILPAASKQNVDLILAGHTHGGQVRMPFIGALYTPFDSGGYEAGWYQEGESRMYVSRGVGTSILPVRFLCRPEVALHRVRFSK